ncbi:MAG TPA: hypothetical protein VLS85_14380, partial [Hanamia sp.]|nr:hypothetical protein [Hanamia sp.]
MKNETKIYPDIDSICLGDIEEDYTNFPVKTSNTSDKSLLNDDEKIRVIAGHFKEIMKTLGLDLNDDSLKDTPQRVAKMFVKEIFS